MQKAFKSSTAIMEKIEDRIDPKLFEVLTLFTKELEKHNEVTGCGIVIRDTMMSTPQSQLSDRRSIDNLAGESVEEGYNLFVEQVSNAIARIRLSASAQDYDDERFEKQMVELSKKVDLYSTEFCNSMDKFVTEVTLKKLNYVEFIGSAAMLFYELISIDRRMNLDMKESF